MDVKQPFLLVGRSEFYSAHLLFYQNSIKIARSGKYKDVSDIATLDKTCINLNSFLSLPYDMPLWIIRAVSLNNLTCA